MALLEKNDYIALGAVAVVAVGLTYVNHRISKSVIAALKSPEVQVKIAGAKRKPGAKRPLKKVAAKR